MLNIVYIINIVLYVLYVYYDICSNTFHIYLLW